MQESLRGSGCSWILDLSLTSSTLAVDAIPRPEEAKEGAIHATPAPETPEKALTFVMYTYNECSSNLKQHSTEWFRMAFGILDELMR